MRQFEAAKADLESAKELEPNNEEIGTLSFSSSNSLREV